MPGYHRFVFTPFDFPPFKVMTSSYPALSLVTTFYTDLHSSLRILKYDVKEEICDPYDVNKPKKPNLPKFTEVDWLYIQGNEQSHMWNLGMDTDLDYLPLCPIKNPLSHYRVLEIVKYKNPHFDLRHCRFCHDPKSFFSFAMPTVFKASFLATPFEKIGNKCDIRQITIYPTYVPRGGCIRWLHLINEIANKIEIANNKQYMIKKDRFVLKAVSATLSVSASCIQ